MQGARSVAGLHRFMKFQVRWPERLLGSRPTLKQISMVCWLQLAASLILFVAVYGSQMRHETGLFSDYRPDFIYLYGDGRIFNEYPALRLYDYSLQTQVFNQIAPLTKGWMYGPSPYPPFVAMFFSLFARLPYGKAYCLWIGISLFLYITGIKCALATVFPEDRYKRSLILCLALANFPFLTHTIANGQLASIAVFSVGLAIFLEGRSYALYSGLTLSLLMYKPTLLILIVPMLFLTRRFRTLCGFSMGAAILGAVSTAVDGPAIWLAYARFVGLFGNVVGLTGPSRLCLTHYVDLGSVSHEITGGRSTVGMTLLIGVASTVAMTLCVLLWKSRNGKRPVQFLVWATTLTWTLLLNVYVPIYDTVLVTIAIALVLGALTDVGSRTATGWVTALSLAIFVASCKTVGITEDYGIPILSILLSVLGGVELCFLYREIHRREGSETSPELIYQAIM